MSYKPTVSDATLLLPMILAGVLITPNPTISYL